MKWPRALLMLLGFVCAWGYVEIAAAPPVALAGRWRLNRELSEFPKEVAFGIETTDGDAPTERTAKRRRPGRRRRRARAAADREAAAAASAGSIRYAVRESEEDVNKIKELIADAKNPAPVLTIAQTETAVTITDSQDRTRTFHPTGKEETVDLDAGPVGATSKWNGPQLSVQFTVRKDRIFRYLYSRLPSGQLLVETRLEEGRSREQGRCHQACLRRGVGVGLRGRCRAVWLVALAAQH